MNCAKCGQVATGLYGVPKSKELWCYACWVHDYGDNDKLAPEDQCTCDECQWSNNQVLEKSIAADIAFQEHGE